MDYHTRNGLKGNAMKRVYVVEERGFVDKAGPVTKAEEWLPNDYCVPNKAMMRQDDNFAGEGSDTNKAGRTWIYDDDRGRNKVARASSDRKAPRGKSNPGGMTCSSKGSLKQQKHEKGKERNNILLHCRSSFSDDLTLSRTV